MESSTAMMAASGSRITEYDKKEQRNAWREGEDDQ